MSAKVNQLTPSNPGSYISLIEEFLLLTLEDKGGEFDNLPEIYLNCSLAGAALMELALKGRIDSDLEGVFVVDRSPTGDATLDRVLDEMTIVKQPQSAEYWIKRLSRIGPSIHQECLARLCERDVLAQRDQSYFWVLKERRYPIVEGKERPEAKNLILALLYNDDIPNPEDIALLSLADASMILERILKPKELKRVKPRIDQITRMDLISGEIARTAHRLNLETLAAEKRTIIAGLAGNVMEWYDFGIYGFFAETIGKEFFPSHDPFISLMASFGVFAVGFIARP